MILIPANYWDGHKTLELEYPWFTPGAIDCLDKYLIPEYDVLEFGCGGSTMFFSRRCKSVTSFDSNLNWVNATKKQVEKKKIKNVNITHLPNMKACIDAINKIERKFDVILVDNNPNDLDRFTITKMCVPLLKKMGFLILDNYSCGYCGNTDSLFKGYKITNFDDLHWHGTGTKIYHKG